MKARIHSRIDTCKCGCQGRDSMHARYFVRVVKDVIPFNQNIETAWGWTCKAKQLAQATFPWGVETVADTVLHGWVRMSAEFRKDLIK